MRAMIIWIFIGIFLAYSMSFYGMEHRRSRKRKYSPNVRLKRLLGVRIDDQEERSKRIRQLVLVYKANPDVTSRFGDCGLIFAARDDDEMVRFLLQNNANPNAINRNGFPALAVAVIHNNFKTAIALLKVNTR